MSRSALMLVACLAVGCGASPPVNPSAVRFTDPSAAARAPDPQHAARLLEKMPAIDAYLAGEIARVGYPGAAVGLVIGKELAWFRGYGVANMETGAPVTLDTIYRIGSITKTFTGLSILALRDEGKLSLEDPISKYLPEAAEVLYPTRDSPQIRIRHLLTHTSGLPREGALRGVLERSSPSEADVAGALRGVALEASPGVRETYSNLGAALAGVIVARASGERYRDFVARRLFAPLGMTHSSFDPDAAGDALAQGYRKVDGRWRREDLERMGAAEAMGGIYSSMRDMAKYVAFQMDAWPPRDDPEGGPVRRASVRESQESEGYQLAGSEQIGAYWIVYNDCILGHLVFHNGAVSDGYKATIFMMPESHLGMILLTNAFVDKDLNALDGVTREAMRRLFVDASEVPGMRAAIERLLAAMKSPDDASMRAAFSAGFLRKAPDLARFVARLEDDSGGCAGATPTQRTGTASADVDITCARKHWSAKVGLDKEGKISLLVVRSAGSCQ